MVSSMQVVGDKQAVLSDLSLLAFLGFALERMDAESPRFDALAGVEKRWRDERNGAGPGTLDLGLESISDGSMAPIVADLLREVESEALRFREVVPASVMNSRFRQRGVRFSDFPVPELLRVTNALRMLLGLPEESK